MHHSYVDNLAYRDTPLSHVDPRAKLMATVLYVLALSLVPPGDFGRLGSLAVLLMLFVLAGSVPLLYLLKRSLLVLPFAGPVALVLPFTHPCPCLVGPWGIELSRAGLEAAGSILCKAMLAASALLVLAATTRFAHLLTALRWYRIPGLFVDILSFLYRYLFLIVDEGQRITRARKARSCGRFVQPVRTSAAMISTMVGRSSARSERVYLAMLARGYDGTIHTFDSLPTSRWHMVFGVLAATLALGLALSPMPTWLSRGLP